MKVPFYSTVQRRALSLRRLIGYISTFFSRPVPPPTSFSATKQQRLRTMATAKEPRAR